MTSIETLTDYVRNDLHGTELSGYAASAAAATLLRNWADALADGNTDNLVADVDVVIQKLRDFKSKAQTLLPAANGGLT